MAVQFVALLIFAAVFIVAELRRAHIGIVMFAAAVGVGLWLAGLPVKRIVEGFPTDIIVLLVGVTFFFGVAKANGTIGRLVDWALARVGRRTRLLPLTFFGLTAIVSAMGAPLGALVMYPIGMSVAHRSRIDPMLMGLALGCGLSAGAFMPTSLFGLVAWRTATGAGIALNPLTLAATAIVTNVVLLGAAYLMFGTPRGAVAEALDAQAPLERGPFAPIHAITTGAMLGLAGAVMGLAVAGQVPDVGVLAFGFGAVLSLIDPRGAREGLKEIDWSTVLLVGGIITYVGVLQEMGAVDMLGDAAAGLTVPLLAALVICAVGGLVSAFASTTGILAALVPLAIPLAQQGAIPGWALICALAVCSSLVDVSPFSTVGATLVASASDPAERPRMTRLLTRWGLSMVVLGPLALVGALVLPAMAS